MMFPLIILDKQIKFDYNIVMTVMLIPRIFVV